MKHFDRMTTSELLDLFIQAAQGYEEGIESGSAKKADRNTSMANRIVEELEQRGAERELLMLLAHPLPIVRGRAASYTLRFAPEAAVPILEDLAENTSGTPAAHAMTRLMMWRDSTRSS